MLHQAHAAVASVRQSSEQWRNPYGEPRPEKVVEEASVWMFAYPGSVITGPKESVIAAWANPALWDAFRQMGIELLHTGPIQRAGGIRDRKYTPSVDGWFDPISLEIDPQLGTEEDYHRLIQVAGTYGAGIAGDLVPLHTGKVADFLLALRAYKDDPRAKALYGSLPEQLRDPTSFASRLRQVLEARRRHKIHFGKLLAVPDVDTPAMCVLLWELPDEDSYAITALNFGRQAVRARLDLGAMRRCGAPSLAGRKLLDAVSGKVETTVAQGNRCEIAVERLAGKTLILARSSDRTAAR